MLQGLSAEGGESKMDDFSHSPLFEQLVGPQSDGRVAGCSSDTDDAISGDKGRRRGEINAPSLINEADTPFIRLESPSVLTIPFPIFHALKLESADG